MHLCVSLLETLWCAEQVVVDSGAGSGLELLLNIEDYEKMPVGNLERGVQVFAVGYSACKNTKLKRICLDCSVFWCLLYGVFSDSSAQPE